MSWRRRLFFASVSIAPALMAVGFAQAQTPPASAGNLQTVLVEEIVVTGTSIRGAPPVGSNLISVGKEAIEATNAQTVQQVLKSVPAVTGLGSAGQGGFGSADGGGSNSPNIHDLGGSASNSTLILVDGHRLPLTGINHTLADPNIVPPIAIERVEVLPDGASSVYGSDAVAGVINFVTRRRYEGVLVSGQVGVGDKYHTYNANLLAGRSWDTGSAMLAYSYSDRTALSFADRDYTRPDHRAQGGTNFASFNCAPATIQPAGSTSIFYSPYTSSVANATANAACDYTGAADILPRDQRNSVMLRMIQSLTDDLTLNADVIYSARNSKARISRGAITATVFGPGSGRGTQINPFYANPTGVTATSQTVRFDANELLGPGARALTGADTFMFTPELEYRLSDNLRITAGGTFGKDNTKLQQVGVICSSCANLALNGTTNGSGSTTLVSVPGTNQIVLNGPLTTANALDVYHTGSANLTSAAVRSQLIDNTSTQLANQTIADARIKVDGDLFTLPGGTVKFAVGAQYTRYTMHQDITLPINTGPASTGSSTKNLDYDRNVGSAYAELLVPIIGEGNALPLVQALNINLSGRYDDYSDVGSTQNPKIAIDWTVVNGLKLRANAARSFVAPALTSSGIAGTGITGQSGYRAYALGTFNAPASNYPQVALLPGCIGASACQLGNSTLTGLMIEGGSAGLQPQKGKTWSIGADYSPEWLSGLRLSATYWTSKLNGGINAPSPTLAISAPDLRSFLTIYPNGATPADITARVGSLPVTGAVPATIYYIYDQRQYNVLNLDIAGVDLDGSYRVASDWGVWTLAGGISRKTKFDQRIGSSPVFDVLNTTGFNNTFPSIQTQARASLAWTGGPLSAELFANYTGSYKNYSGNTVTPVIRTADGLPAGGGDTVDSSTTFDLHIGYDLSDLGPFQSVSEAEVYIDGNNIFDKEPEFYNGPNGYDPNTGNPIGRVISLGFRTKF